MRPVKIAFELGLNIFCSWTLAYELCLVLNFPAISILAPFFLFLVPMLWVSARYWRFTSLAPPQAPERIDWPILSVLAVISLAAGTFTLIVLRPDPDDSLFFYRALAQLGSLTKPFSIQDSPLDSPGVMVGTVLHHMTSYEMLTAMAARLFRINPVWLYHNGMPFIAAAILPFVYFLLYREFGVGRKAAIGGTALAFVFLLVDGNVHRSFGNFGLVRLWQGKCIVVTVLLPAALLLARRFFDRPSKMAFSRLAMIGVCGIGLSEVGLYLIPMIVLAVSLAYLITERTGASFRLVVMSWASMLFPLLIGAGFLIGLLPEPRSTGILSAGFSFVWWKNLQVVIDSASTLIRDLLILFLVPLIGLKGNPRWFVISLGVVLVLLFANPVTGSLWIDLMFPASHWRMAYLLPLPWLFGLLSPGLASAFSDPWYPLALGRGLLLAVVITSTAAACQSTVLYAVKRSPSFKLEPVIGFKSPGECQFSRNPLSFVRGALPELRGKDVLGPDNVNYIICLLDPGVRLVSTRSDYTNWAFEDIGRAAEGRARVAAQTMISSCSDSPEGRQGLKHCIANGLNAIISRDCGKRPDPLPAILEKGDLGLWKEVHRDHGFVLYVRASSEWDFLNAP